MIAILSSGPSCGTSHLQRLLKSTFPLLPQLFDDPPLVENLLQTDIASEDWALSKTVVSSDRLLRARQAWFNAVFAGEPHSGGSALQGVIAERLSIAHAERLRRIYPDAKFVFLIRDPYAAFNAFSQRATPFNDAASLAKTPLNAQAFGSRWHTLAAGFVASANAFGLIIQYEDLVRGNGLVELEKYLNVVIDQKLLPAEPGNSEINSKLSSLDLEVLRRQVEPLSTEMGYRPPATDLSIGDGKSHSTSAVAIVPREKCVVLVPVGSYIEPRCDEALYELERRGYKVWRVRGYSAIDQGRNQMATDALAAGYEETLWIDSDVAFHPDDVDKLRAHGRPVVCGIYPKKGRRELAAHVVPGTNLLTFGKRGGLMELKYAATGFLLVRKVVYETIQRELALPSCNEQFGKPMIPFFQPLIVDSTAKHAVHASESSAVAPWYLAEDFAFCERARRCGFHIMADTSIRLFHIGSYPYSWEEVGHEVRRVETFDLHLTGPPASTIPTKSASPATASKKLISSSPNALHDLRTATPWPSEPPAIPLPTFEAGPFEDIEKLLQQTLSATVRLVVELGSNAGSRTQSMALHAPQATIIACDPWRGTEESIGIPQRGTTFQRFLAHCWEFRGQITLIRGELRSSLSQLIAAGIRPEVIYLDGDRDYDGVRGDVLQILQSFPHAELIGGDFDWPGVELGVTDAAKKSKRTLHRRGTGWKIDSVQ